jgi:hypothetical protein
MNIDPIEQFKNKQRETWTMGNFGDIVVRHEYLLTRAIKV